MPIDIENPGAEEAALIAALKALLDGLIIGKSPTHTSQALSGATVDVAIPAGVTRFRFAAPNITMASSAGAPFAKLRNTGNTVDTAMSGIREQGATASDLSASASVAVSGADSGTSRDLFGDVISPRDSAKKTIASGWGRSTGNLFKQQTLADSAQDDDTLQFLGNGANFSSGTVEIEWFYN